MRAISRCGAVAALFVVIPSVNADEIDSAPTTELEAFDSVAAWDEFEMLLRDKYAYIERNDIDVEAQLARSRAIARSAANQVEFRRIIHQTALTFMDPHLIAGPFEDDDFAIIMTAADLDLRFKDGRAIVVDVRRGSPAFEAGIRPGNEILQIDNLPPEAAARLPLGDVLPQPSAAQYDYGLTLAANGRRAGSRALVVKSGDGTTMKIELQSTHDWAKSLWERPTMQLEMVGDDGKVAILRPLNSLGDNKTISDFDAAMEQANAAGAQAIVLDMRETPSGGNTEVARSIIGHFVTETKPYQMHRIPAFEREFTVPRQFVEYVLPREPQFQGPVFVLHGRWTGSMGEGIVIGMDAATDAVTIGSNMGDLLGGLWNWDLEKSDVRVDLGGEALFHVDGTPREDYVGQVPIMPANTAPDGSDPAMAVVFDRLEHIANGN